MPGDAGADHACSDHTEMLLYAHILPMSRLL
jgi:hypothetical protein